MKHIKCLLLLFVIVLSWFSSNIEGAFASTYPSSVAWNNFLYSLSAEEVDSKDIGNEIGKIKHQRTPMPLKSGESNIKHHVGSSLFEIKGVDIEDAIAVKVDDKFFKASQVGPLQELSNEKTWVATLSVVGLVVVLLTTMIIWRNRRRIG